MFKHLLLLSTLCLWSTQGHPSLGLPPSVFSLTSVNSIKISDILNGLRDPPPPPPKKLVCPPAKIIAPCKCDSDFRAGVCSGSKVTQSKIDNFFTQIRSINKISSSDYLQMFIFAVTGTPLKTLDVTFPNLNVSLLQITENKKLSALTSSTGSGSNNGGSPGPVSSFIALGVFLGHNVLDDNGVAPIFSQVDKSQLRIVAVNNNRLTGTGGLLQGLSDMTALNWLSLDNNQISSIASNQFNSNRNLFVLTLSNNVIDTLSDNALVFNEDTDLPKNISNVISFEKNLLNGPNSFSDSALSGITRPTLISFGENQLTTLAANQFQQFLDNSNKNLLIVAGNMFECNSSLAWLKKQRESYEPHVYGVECANDEGKTAFTSDKV